METVIEIGTILSHRTKEGKIDFLIKNEEGEFKTQWDLAKAREILSMLSQAIEASVSDELIYKFLTVKVGMSDEKASYALMDFRELRQGSRNTVYPS